MSGGGSDTVQHNVNQNGLPKRQNKAVIGAMRGGQGIYNSYLPQIENLSAPAGVPANAGPLSMTPAPPVNPGSTIPPWQQFNPNSAGTGSGGIGGGAGGPHEHTMNPMGGGGGLSAPPQGPTGGGGSNGPQMVGRPALPAPDFGGESQGGQQAGGGGQQGGGPGTVQSPLPTSGGGPENTGNLGNQLEQQTLTGQFLNPATNPYLSAYSNAAAQNTINQYQTAIQPSLQSEFAMAGNFGGSSMMDAQQNAQYELGQNLQDLNANIYEPAYQQERQNQMSAMGMIPEVQQGMYGPLEQPLNFQNQYNQGLMGLMSPFGYGQQWQQAPQDNFTVGQGVGAGLGLAGLGMYP